MTDTFPDSSDPEADARIEPQPATPPSEGVAVDAMPAASTVTWNVVGPAQETAPDAAGETAAVPPRRRRRSAVFVGAWIAAGLVIASLLGIGTYLYAVHTQYVSQNDQLRQEANTLGAQLAQARTVNETQAAELTTVETQLAQAKGRISALANEAAQAGDDRLALVDVGAGLVQCANQRQTLIGNLKQASLYTTSSLRASEAQITTFCDKAESVYSGIVSGK